MADMDQQELISLNIGGQKFLLLSSNCLRYPETLLSDFVGYNFEKRCEIANKFIPQTNEFFFDRSPVVFESISEFYRTGKLHFANCQQSMCIGLVKEECEFWKIDFNKYCGECCLSKLSQKNDKRNQSLLEINSNLLLSSRQSSMEIGDCDMPVPENHAKIDSNCPSPIPLNLNRRETVVYFIDRPHKHIVSGIFTTVSMSFICMTIITLIMSSIPEFQHIDPETNVTVIDQGLEIADTVTVAWFTFEYLLRLWASSNKCAYIKDPISIIDIIGILPFYIELAVSLAGFKNKSVDEIGRSIVIVRVLRVLRILRCLRILKVARYSKGFQSMGETLSRSWRELLLLMVFMLTANILFSTVIYFIEIDDPKTMFHSIPEAAWWCIITMTTVGYGDVYPVTICGKIIASMVCITGIILLAFPISLIVENFNHDYNNKKSNRNGSISTALRSSIPETGEPNRVARYWITGAVK